MSVEAVVAEDEVLEASMAASAIVVGDEELRLHISLSPPPESDMVDVLSWGFSGNGRWLERELNISKFSKREESEDNIEDQRLQIDI